MMDRSKIDRELLAFQYEHCPEGFFNYCIRIRPGESRDETCEHFGIGSAGCLHPDHPNNKTNKSPVPPPDPFVDTGHRIGELVSKKNAAYGDSFRMSRRILDVFFPDGIRPDQYEDILTMVRIIDKLFRIANQKNAFGEDPWEDIAGYAILMNTAKETDHAEA